MSPVGAVSQDGPEPFLSPGRASDTVAADTALLDTALREGFAPGGPRALGRVATSPASPAFVGGARTVRALQRSAGNAAVTRLLQRTSATRVAQRDPGATVAPTAVKHTLTLPDHSLGKKEVSYAQVGAAVGGVIDFEFTPASAPAPSAAPAPAAAPDPAGGGPTVKGAAGVNATPDGARYQAEVTAEFEKRTEGLFAGCTPKAKLGGEVGKDGSKLGIEFSMEGQNFEPKFAFNLLEISQNDGIHFAVLEAALDWKMAEFPFTTADGTAIKISAKPTVKVKIEPNYRKIFMQLAEEAAITLGAEALIAGGMILIGAATIGGFILTYGDGADYAKAIDHAEAARTKIVAGFVAGALNEDMTFADDFSMEGHNWGAQWRRDVSAGKNAKGLPIPKKVMDDKAKEFRTQIRSSAEKTANQILHQALVERYWEIHYIQKWAGIGSIDTIFMMLMEGQGFGRPGAEEGRSGSGTSVLGE